MPAWKFKTKSSFYFKEHILLFFRNSTEEPIHIKCSNLTLEIQLKVERFNMKLLVACIVTLSFIQSSFSLQQTTALKNALLAGYQKGAKPDGKVVVNFGARILNVQLCPHKQVNLLK